MKWKCSDHEDACEVEKPCEVVVLGEENPDHCPIDGVLCNWVCFGE